MPKGSSKSEIRKKFHKQITALQETAAAVAESVSGEQRKWFKPDGWDGEHTSAEGMSEPFDRTELTEDLRNAIKIEGGSCGTVSDLMSAQLQGDFLAAMETAFRAENCGPIRATILAAGRRKAQGMDSGTLKRGIQGYLENLLRLGKSNA